ncbi:MAG: imidazole glycerol phosphate synthase subunit HisH [Candidatus Omnitrophica bacterium]|jgi:glutamine amidotransferase|nr:imidazole glycerol phosphate synthase subunit HisH [Candidatus Omnitrophota bacterium]MDD5440918.1 imidazole glycerol phosphate synthase subunit HisH [Candidatus Omnitrophota bacterium]
MKVVIVDYGMGNLGSVKNVLIKAGINAVITESKEIIRKADKLIFPGVGHFGECVRQLRKRELVSVIKEMIKRGVPILGICVGMQLLLEESEEAPGLKGLGVIKGKVKKFKGEIVIPHMGWSKVRFPGNRREKKYRLFSGTKDNNFFYFAHSYYCVPEKKAVLAVTDYGKEYVSAMYKDNIWAVQFHPEKSQSAGLKIIENFVQYCK